MLEVLDDSWTTGINHWEISTDNQSLCVCGGVTGEILIVFSLDGTQKREFEGVLGSRVVGMIGSKDGKSLWLTGVDGM
jgi:hypothetical protein